MKRDLRIVFMGTPEFAVASLGILLENKYQVVGVITAPDKPAGRGNQLQQSAVKKFAVEKGLNILQPEKLKAPEFIEQLQALQANLFVVVAFRMLPEVVWSMPEFGTFNLHASLLPQYRGAAPINWALINGETETGVTTFFLQHEIDTGNILFQDKINIDPKDNAGIVHDKLMEIGAALVLKTTQAIEENTITPLPQSTFETDASNLKHAPKLFKETCLIHWNNPAKSILNLIRGLSPYPTAFMVFNHKNFKIFSAAINTKSVEEMSPFHKTENCYSDNKTFLSFQCADFFIDILEIQLEGKKRMPIDEFLRGFKF